MSYNVQEIFTSFQGEGIYLGTRALFVRFQGCNLDCSFCDTEHRQYADTYSEDELVDIIKIAMRKEHIRHLVLTGGEPLLQVTGDFLQKLADPLNELLGKQDYIIQIETNGTAPIDLPSRFSYIIHVSCSPKVESGYVINSTLRPFIKELKYVCDERFTGVKIDCLLGVPIWIQPCDEIGAKKRKQLLIKAIRFVENNPQFRLGIQAHKTWGVA